MDDCVDQLGGTFMSVALCLLAAAIWLSGRRKSPARLTRTLRMRTVSSRRVPPAVLRCLGAGAVLAAGVVLFGPVRGGLGGLAVAPLVGRLIGLAQARAVLRAPPDAVQRVPLVLDLLAAALHSGQPVAAAVAVVAPVAGDDHGERLRLVAGLLRFGADPAVAWASLSDSVLAPVAGAAVRSAESGLRLARGFELLAAELRDEARAAALARAHRAGVWAMAPLGLCFLPAFACLGVLPVIVGIAYGVLTGTP
jgi:pilus assembly protein TadC